MSPVHPFFREAGSGPGVVCVHANASTSGQWKDLMALLAPRFHVLAADSYGSGQSPEWPSDSRIALLDEAALLEPVLARAGTPLVLAGHSYGAAVALVAALANPGRVRDLVLYEPTLFALIDGRSTPPNAADGARDTVARATRALDDGNLDEAARIFIDYWMGPGAWDATPPNRQPAIAASVKNLRRWGHALLTEPTPLQAFSALDMPVLLMSGNRSTPAAHAVSARLETVLPRLERVNFPELGHMGPVTHPAVVNAAIARFLQAL